MNTISSRLFASAKNALPNAFKTIWWLLKLILPISLLVSLLQYSGFIALIAQYLAPAFSLIGLPGESAIVFISSMFIPLYGSIAIISTLSLDMREITILALMCLITHNLVVETAIQKKTGSSGVTMLLLRIFSSFIAAVILNSLLPINMGGSELENTNVAVDTIGKVLHEWVIGSGWLTLKISVIIVTLMVLQNILKEFHIIDFLSKIFAPLMRIMGLSKNCSFLWLVAQTLGLTYGSAIMLDAVDKKEIELSNANFLNYHIAINHSLLEDTLLFVVIGVPALWIVVPRIFLAVVVVWMVRFTTWCFTKHLVSTNL